MSIPNLAQPLFTVEKDDRSGNVKAVNVNSNFILMLQQLITELQRALSNEGWKPPQLDAATIAQLNTAASIGSFVFNKTTGKFMGNESGTFRTFTMS